MWVDYLYLLCTFKILLYLSIDRDYNSQNSSLLAIPTNQQQDRCTQELFIRKYINTYLHHTFMRHKHIHQIHIEIVFNVETHREKTTKAPFIQHEKYMAPFFCALSLQTLFQIFFLHIYRLLYPLMLSSLYSLRFPLLHSTINPHIAWIETLFYSTTLQFYKQTQTKQEVTNRLTSLEVYPSQRITI